MVALSACGGTSTPSAADAAKVDIGPGVPANITDAMRTLYKNALDSGKTRVVVYGPVSTELQPVWNIFQKRFPGLKVVPRDMADAESAAKIDAEKASGQHEGDLFHGGGSVAISYAQDGRCGPATVAAADLADKSKYVQVDGKVFVPYVSGFGTVYNTSMVKPDEAPKDWQGLLDPKWSGKLSVQNPNQVSIVRVAFSRMLLPEAQAKYGENYLRQLAAQKPNKTSTGPQVAADVASGRFPVGAVVSVFFYNAQKAKGAPIGMVFPLASGNILTDTSSCMVAGAPDPDAAQLLMDWMFTPEGQAAVADKMNVYGTANGAPAPKGSPPLSQVDQMPDIVGGNSAAYNQYATRVDAIFGN
jgi:iron(III) transport system substrate-binding protein